MNRPTDKTLLRQAIEIISNERAIAFRSSGCRLCVLTLRCRIRARATDMSVCSLSFALGFVYGGAHASPPGKSGRKVPEHQLIPSGS